MGIILVNDIQLLIMPSEDAYTLLREFKSMTEERYSDVVRRDNLRHQLKEKENWSEIRYHEAETELIHEDVIMETLDGDQLQALQWHI